MPVRAMRTVPVGLTDDPLALALRSDCFAAEQPRDIFGNERVTKDAESRL